MDNTSLRRPRRLPTEILVAVFVNSSCRGDASKDSGADLSGIPFWTARPSQLAFPHRGSLVQSGVSPAPRQPPHSPASAGLAHGAARLEHPPGFGVRWLAGNGADSAFVRVKVRKTESQLSWLQYEILLRFDPQGARECFSAAQATPIHLRAQGLVSRSRSATHR